MAELEVISTTAYTITVEASGLDKSHDYVRHFKWYLDGRFVEMTDLAAHGESISYTYNNLTPSTSYAIKAESWSWDAEKHEWDTAYLQTTLFAKASTADAPLSKWSWSSSELSAFNNHGPVSTLTAARWNSFIDTINQVASSKGVSQIESSARATSGQVLTANKFNLVNNCINYMNQTGVPWISPGDIIYGRYFTAMSNAFNNIT